MPAFGYKFFLFFASLTCISDAWCASNSHLPKKPAFRTVPLVRVSSYENSVRGDPASGDPTVARIGSTGRTGCTNFFVKNTRGKIIVATGRHCFDASNAIKACKDKSVEIRDDKLGILGTCKDVISVPGIDFTLFEITPSNPNFAPEHALRLADFYPSIGRYFVSMVGFPADTQRNGALTKTSNCWILDSPRSIHWQVNGFAEDLVGEASYFNCTVFGGNSGGPVYIDDTDIAIGVPQTYEKNNPMHAATERISYLTPTANFVRTARQRLNDWGVVLAQSEPDRRVGPDFNSFRIPTFGLSYVWWPDASGKMRCYPTNLDNKILYQAYSVEDEACSFSYAWSNLVNRTKNNAKCYALGPSNILIQDTPASPERCELSYVVGIGQRCYPMGPSGIQDPYSDPVDDARCQDRKIHEANAKADSAGAIVCSLLQINFDPFGPKHPVHVDCDGIKAFIDASVLTAEIRSRHAARKTFDPPMRIRLNPSSTKFYADGNDASENKRCAFFATMQTGQDQFAASERASFFKFEKRKKGCEDFTKGKTANTVPDAACISYIRCIDDSESKPYLKACAPSNLASPACPTPDECAKTSLSTNGEESIAEKEFGYADRPKLFHLPPQPPGGEGICAGLVGQAPAIRLLAGISRNRECPKSNILNENACAVSIDAPIKPYPRNTAAPSGLTPLLPGNIAK